MDNNDAAKAARFRQLDALQAKVSAPYVHHREPSRHVIEFRSGDMSSFWLLHTASTACAADPGPAFAALHRIIRALLDTVISSRYFAIAITLP
jgi:type VI secretion system protein ImpJ